MKLRWITTRKMGFENLVYRASSDGCSYLVGRPLGTPGWIAEGWQDDTLVMFQEDASLIRLLAYVSDQHDKAVKGAK